MLARERERERANLFISFYYICAAAAAAVLLYKKKKSKSSALSGYISNCLSRKR